jgi:F0F1-type ATP synthase membrane subunit c/vacuolar-type H+-ATPase subunit K
MFGVISDDPAVEFVGDSLENTRPVLTSGNVVVRVAGVVEAGDLVTSSSSPGVGQAVTVDGYVLGTALESFDPATPDQEGQILVSLSIHAAGGVSGPRANLISNFRGALSVPILSPLVSLRYLLAFIIVVIGFTLGFVYFGRTARTGVEAIGRNPLARRAIQVSVFVNVLLGITMIVGSLIIAALILIF